MLDANNNPINAVADINYNPKTQIDYTNKLFFEEPGQDVMTAYTTSSVNEQLAKIIPVYKGAGTAAEVKDNVSYGTTGAGGTFSFTIKKGDTASTGSDGVYVFSEDDLNAVTGKTFRINLDFSGYKLDENYKPVTGNNGEWAKNSGTKSESESNNIVKLSATINGEGTYNIVWNGEDSYGNKVPKGVYGGTDNSVISTALEQGSVHFPLIDVERVPNGIKIERLTNPDDGTKYNIYYNNEAPNNSWYFAGEFNGLQDNKTNTPVSTSYPSKIGDGRNYSAGVDTSKNPAPAFGDYDGDDKKFNNAVATEKDPTKADTRGRISDVESAYGNYCAIDMWSNYTNTLNINDLTIGVQDTRTVRAKANVTFIQADKDTKGADGTPFVRSHVIAADGTRTNLNAYGNSGSGAVFGNTITTGFTAAIAGNGTELKSAAVKVTIPAGSYVKATDASKNGWSLADAAVLEDKGNVVYNTGSIFKTNAGKTINLSYSIPTATGSDILSNLVYYHLNHLLFDH